MKYNGEKLLEIFASLLIGSLVSATCPSVAMESMPTSTEKYQSLTDTQIAAGKLILKSLHELVLNTPITPEKVSAAFGWQIVRQKEPGEIEYTNFDLFPRTPWKNPQLRQFSDGRVDLLIQFESESICIPSESLLFEFGDDYKPTTANIDRFSDSTFRSEGYSETVKNNLNRFLYGPRYRLQGPITVNIYFKYFHSECLESIFVTHPSN